MDAHEGEHSTRPVFVSACLLGRTCRYDGRHNDDDLLRRELAARGEHAVPFCPEEEGGLGTPRPPAWLTSSAADVVAGRARVVTDEGLDVTAAFTAGAERALDHCRAHGITRAYLKERSPSCGCANTHVNDSVAEGPGVTTHTLRAAGIETIGIEGRRRVEDAH
jgi:uncharacterized protein YbbK (DUF523 family)